MNQTVENVFPTERNYTAAVILAAGSSTRFGDKVNKQWQKIGGMSVLARTLVAYQDCPYIREIHVVCKKEDFNEVLELQKQYKLTKLIRLTVGGNNRQESASNGVSELSDNVKFVAIADGARCLTTPEQIGAVCVAAYKYNAASAGHKVSDTVRYCNPTGKVRAAAEREGLWEVQTPQVIQKSLYVAGLMNAVRQNKTETDDETLVTALGYEVQLVECGIENLKITTPFDLPVANAIVAYREKSGK